MLESVKRLKSIIWEIEEPLDQFDEKLFREIVQEVTIDNKDIMTVTLLGGLKFEELI